MANRRVSLKGKGADLFFGDYSPSVAPDAPLPDGQPPHEPSKDEASVPAGSSQNSTEASQLSTPSRRRSKTPSINQPVAQSTDQSIDQSTDQSTDESIRHRLNPIPGSKIVDRPKGFYITERLDARLGEAVRYYQQVHGLRKVDRSVIVTAILDDNDLWSEESLDALLDRIINQLTSRLTNR